MDSPLAMQFNEFDTDGDGRINDNQTYELMKVLGKNVYIGSVRQVIFLSNTGDETSKLCRPSSAWHHF
jgi:Ca2+-binding EF-hand superfamily protein